MLNVCATALKKNKTVCDVLYKKKERKTTIELPDPTAITAWSISMLPKRLYLLLLPAFAHTTQKTHTVGEMPLVKRRKGRRWRRVLDMFQQRIILQAFFYAETVAFDWEFRRPQVVTVTRRGCLRITDWEKKKKKTMPRSQRW